MLRTFYSNLGLARNSINAMNLTFYFYHVVQSYNQQSSISSFSNSLIITNTHYFYKGQMVGVVLKGKEI